MAEVGITIFFGFATARAFQVHDFNNARIHRRDIQRATGFEQDGFSEIAEAGHQGQDIGLEEGFASGHFDKLSFKAVHLGEDVVEGAGLAVVEGVSGVAPGAAEVTAGQADKDARPSGIRGFPLNAVKDFIDNQRVRHSGTLTNALADCKQPVSKDELGRVKDEVGLRTWLFVEQASSAFSGCQVVSKRAGRSFDDVA